MEAPYQAREDVHVLPSYYPVPGFGILPVNAFLIRAAQPVLVDTGLPADRDRFLAALAGLVDLRDLRWLWLTHADPDHVGCLERILVEAPRLEVITTFLGAGKLGVFSPLLPQRMHLLNPGQSLDVGDRRLRAVKPPSFDAPETTGFLDESSGTLFSSDCFGALLAQPATDAGAIPQADLAARQTLWATIDAPWLELVDEDRLMDRLDTIGELAPDLVLSSHLPPARGLCDRFLATLAAVPEAPPFVGPDQAALQRMLSGVTAAPPPT
jgi:flavorubredoxin